MDVCGLWRLHNTPQNAIFMIISSVNSGSDNGSVSFGKRDKTVLTYTAIIVMNLLTMWASFWITYCPRGRGQHFDDQCHLGDNDFGSAYTTRDGIGCQHCSTSCFVRVAL